MYQLVHPFRISVFFHHILLAYSLCNPPIDLNCLCVNSSEIFHLAHDICRRQTNAFITSNEWNKNWNAIEWIFAIGFFPFVGWPFGRILLYFAPPFSSHPFSYRSFVWQKTIDNTERYTQSVFINFHSHRIVLIFYIFVLLEFVWTRSAYAMDYLKHFDSQSSLRQW